MKINKKINQKEIAGITLIALVITIIVLLILAGISISMLSGDNSILNQAGRARDITGEKAIEEGVQLAYLGALANGTGNVTPEEFKQELIKQFGSDKISDDNITQNADGSFTVTIDGVEANAGGSGITPPPSGTSNLTDGEKTKLASNGIAELTGDAITNDNLKDTTKIKAVITGQVPIPVEATYEEGTVDTGVVVSIDGSEFVWVPVPNVIASSAPSTTGIDLASNPNTERPMAILQSGSDTNYQGVLYNFSGTTSTARSIVSVTGSSYREPAYLTDSSYGDASSYNTVGITQSSLQGEYNSMIASISKYGGFYVGRYELGLEGTNPVSKPASASVTTANAANSNTNSWYGLYSKCKSYSVDNLTSTMMWGSQYDAMMNWMAKTGKTVGTADSSKYNTEQITGSKSEDVVNNIFDLYGCHYAWTLEASDTNVRVLRGGNYYNSYSPSHRYPDIPYRTAATYGSRLSLYIK